MRRAWEWLKRQVFRGRARCFSSNSSRPDLSVGTGLGLRSAAVWRRHEQCLPNLRDGARGGSIFGIRIGAASLGSTPSSSSSYSYSFSFVTLAFSAGPISTQNVSGCVSSSLCLPRMLRNSAFHRSLPLYPDPQSVRPSVVCPFVRRPSVRLPACLPIRVISSFASSSKQPHLLNSYGLGPVYTTLLVWQRTSIRETGVFG